VNEPDQEIEVIEPMYAPWDGRRVPVTLLGGYLGSGKTTVINEMLRRTDTPIAVFVNDVGSVNIDASLIKRQDGDTLDLTGGCVCCSLKNGFLEAFEQLRNRPEPPELVVVELSGIANPRSAAALSETPGFVLDGVVVLVDLDRFLELDDESSVVRDSIRTQVQSADVILLTKRDLVDSQRESAVRARLAELVPDVPVFEVGSAYSAAGLVGLATRRPVADIDSTPTLFDVHKTDVIALPGTQLREEIEQLLERLGPEVVRAKAIVQIETGEMLLVQRVGNRNSVEPLPMAESQPTTDLIVISV